MRSDRSVKPRGYTMEVYKAIHAAEPTHIGVQLGRFCVDKNISVTKVATDMGVSRLTVYNWFLGRVYPKPDKVAKMTELLAAYEAQSV